MDKAAGLGRAANRPGDFGQRRRAGWTLPFVAGLVVVGLPVLLLAAAVVAFQMIHADRMFPGVRVGDTMVSGMTRESALAELEPLLADRVHRPLLVRAIGTVRPTTPADLGASFDAAAAVEAAYAVGRTGGWGERLGAQLGAMLHGYSVESPGLKMDRSKFAAFVAGVAREVDVTVRDAEMVIGPDYSVRTVSSVVGRKMDVAAAITALEKAVGMGAGSVDLPVAETQPKRVDRDVAEAAARVAKILSGPVALEFEGRRWSLEVKEIAALLSVEQRVGIPAPVVSLRDQPLIQMVDKIAGQTDQAKQNARYDWNGGNLKALRPGQDGRKVNRDKSLAALKEAIAGDRRTVALPVEVDRAAGGSLDPASLGIKERIELGRTTISGVPEKIYNIKLAASRLNGVLLAPGDTFSFNKELGPTTLKSGFQTGFGISVTNGQMETVPSVAGGICQVATTLLHAVFWAGYQIEERYAHLYWIPNYGLPPKGLTGLDATVDDPTLDLKFVNNTDSFLLIGSSVQGNTLEFALYGTKPTWKVEVEGPIITNVVKADPRMIRQEEPSWPEGKQIQVESATDGMDVNIIRRVTQGGEVRTLNLKSHYQPSRNVLMVGTFKVTPDPSPTPEATPAPGAAPGGTPAATPAAGAPAATPGAATAAPAGATPRPQATPTTPAAPAPAPPRPPATATPQTRTPVGPPPTVAPQPTPRR